MNFKGKRLLVIASHPDDEILGCGGLIGRVKEAGGQVYVLIVTVGSAELYGGNSNLDERVKETKEVMKFIKADDYEIAFPSDEHHLRLDMLPQRTLIDLMESGSKVSLNKVKPDIIALPFFGSSNQDHRSVAQAALTACRPRPHDLKPFQSLALTYEEPLQNNLLETFRPNFYVNLKGLLDFKCQALKLYKSQVKGPIHQCSPETITIMAQSRGREVAIEAAEAFILYRFLV